VRVRHRIAIGGILILLRAVDAGLGGRWSPFRDHGRALGMTMIDLSTGFLVGSEGHLETPWRVWVDRHSGRPQRHRSQRLRRRREEL
jgi:hypothetical protein